MAALHEIARQYAEEIRDGIAWVIIWKTGRSWHAESVWLNQDSDTFELEDLSTATEILEQDPNAVMVNGYYCGHFGENMTIAELEAGILWHYEGGCNLLKDSTAFPPEPIPRPENLPADIPWYGKETTEEPDPYIFDGYMERRGLRETPAAHSCGSGAKRSTPGRVATRTSAHRAHDPDRPTCRHCPARRSRRRNKGSSSRSPATHGRARGAVPEVPAIRTKGREHFCGLPTI